MTDKELLELAAKAAGIDIFCWAGRDVGSFSPVVLPDALSWNPLTEDADALRLAVKLGLQISEGVAEVWRDGKEVGYFFEDEENRYAATRRAITRAAAEIGKEMK
jgi:hypothetical protein